MPGDDRVRHCQQCQLNVYDLSALTRAEVEALVADVETRPCIRIFRRHDGTVLTRDCPVGLRNVRRRLARVVTAFGALVAFITLGACTSCSRAGQAPQGGVFTRLATWIDPPPKVYLGR